MQSPFFLSPDIYSFLYFIKISKAEDVSLELASFINSLNNSEKHIVGVDRSLWSVLSNGQMPSQLYSLNFYGSEYGCQVEEKILIIYSKEELSDFPEYMNVCKIELKSMTLNEGQMAEVFEEDEEFKDCYYGTCLIWKSFNDEIPIVEQVQNLCFDGKVQLLAGKSIYAQDEWIENYFGDSDFNQENVVEKAAHILFLSSEKISTLEDAVRDKEKIHLDEEIKGIYC